MNTAVTILIILFVMMLVLMLMLLMRKRSQQAAAAAMPVTLDVSASAQSEDEPAFNETAVAEKPVFEADHADDGLYIDDLNTEVLPDTAHDEKDLSGEFSFDQDLLDQMLNEEIQDFSIPAELNQTEEDPEFTEQLTSDTQEKEPEFAADDDILLQSPKTEEEDPDTQVSLLKQGVRIAWPDSDVMMKSASIKGSVLYLWQGLSQSNDTVLFDVHEKDLGYPLLEAARRISDQNLKPARKFAFLIHTDDIEEAYCRQSAMSYLRSARLTPSLVISDYAQQNEQTGVLSNYEMIPVGTSPHMVLAAQAPEDTVSKIASLSLRNVRIEDVNETALEAFERMKKDLPFSARSGLSLGIGEKNAVRKAAEKIPQTAGWIFPGFTTAYSSGVTYVTLYAPDEACLENAVSEFRENMRRNSLTFRVMKHVHETVPASADDDVFIELEKAFVSAGLTKTLIPVLSKEDYTIRGIRTLSIPSKHMDRRTVDKLLTGLLLGA